ncbi:CehA/McbA family metallohydrolase [Marinitoga lauensis]|uniref:CehA/McbA family metallohydrolase n=1 Tax=Marinitoga lauensis TaxID=2201189 RepID=UPI0010126A94|nr:CehA/McbA family metallohydrolase [Marinitoga lauensis]
MLFGNPHSHTSFSDGEPGSVPSDAYKYARDIANLDFLAVTDHAYYFEADYNGRDKFDVMKDMANSETTDNFVAIAGFEWTAGSGHINVYESKSWTSRNVKTTTEEFYDWIIKEKALAQFNHPISMFGTFKDFEYYPEADLYINMIEVGNGSWARNETINDEMFGNYMNALKKGWHVGATIGQDNHVANWGTGNDSRTAVWVKEKNKKEILNGFKNRKTYGTEDRNAKVWLETNDAKMGDIVHYTKRPEKIVLKVFYEDPDGEDIKNLNIFTPNKEYTFNNLPSSFEKEIEIQVDSNYFFVFARLDQYDDESIVTSSIWYEPENSIRIFEMPKIKMYKNSNNNYNFYVYNISSKKSLADIKIYIDDNLEYENKFLLGSFEKRLLKTELNLPDKNVVHMKVYINDFLWYEDDIHLESKIKITSLNVNAGFLEKKYVISNNFENESKVILIRASSLEDTSIFDKIKEFSKNKRIGIILDKINKQVLQLIPSKYIVSEKIFKNEKLNNLYYNEGFIITFKNKKRGFVINKNYIIFPGNPFENDSNETFINRLLKIK